MLKFPSGKLSGLVHRSQVPALALIFATASAGITVSAIADERDDETYSIGLWGDLPYSAAQEAALPALFADMNSQPLKFSVHDGDLKQGGGSPCDNALYERAVGWFNSLSAPAMFTPGDNDWTDCDRANNGGFNSRERLEHERQVFFSTPFSLGKNRLRQDVQPGFVENRRWSVGRVTYVTLNVAGSCNNLCDVAPDPTEFQARNAANIAWLKDSFAVATAKNSAGVMIISQANPGWDQTDPTRAPLRDAKTLAETDGQPDGFKDFLVALREQIVAFRKPVAYVHGDSHTPRVDKPLLNEKGQRVENFTRVETYGDNQANGTNDVNWIKVSVDPRSREVFSYQPQVVPANRVAVPPPATQQIQAGLDLR